MVSAKNRSEPDGDVRAEGHGCAGAGQRVIESRAVFGEERTVAIRHGAELYTLRITRAGKLILTK